MTPTDHSQTAYYNDYWAGTTGWTPTDDLDKELEKWLRPIVAAKGKSLDVGCGDGSRYAAHLLQSGIDLYGIDISEVAVARANARGIKASVAFLDQKLPFEDASFDSGVCLEVFEHLMEPALAVAEIFRVLRPGGLFVTSVPNIASWRSRLELSLLGRLNPAGSPVTAIRTPWCDPHIRFFNHASFGRMLTSVGFSVEKSGGLDVMFLGSAPFLRRMIQWPLLRPARKLCEMLGRAWPSLLAGRCVILAKKPVL